MVSNFTSGDEIVIVDDGSTDETWNIMEQLKKRYNSIVTIRHRFNRGGGAARNTAVENAKHPIIFCLDSDNVLTPDSVRPLLSYLVKSGGDVAAFQEVRFFTDNIENITHKWVFQAGLISWADYLAGSTVPGASGNYLFSLGSWLTAGGYPEFAGCMDAWGFGLRQVATGSMGMSLIGFAAPRAKKSLWSLPNYLYHSLIWYTPMT
jgi:glycosyltransferase involved in cell wall biosynthesis